MKLKFKLFSLIIIFCIVISFAIVLTSANEVKVNNNTNSLNDFYNDMEKCNGTFNMTKDYEYMENDSPLIFTGDNYVINGNGHKIDGSNEIMGLTFTNNLTPGKIVINNMTLSNFSGACVGSDFYEVELNNVVFIDNEGSQDGSVTISLSDNITLTNCTFKSNDNSSDISVTDSNMTVNNSTFLENNNTAIIYNRGSLEIENCNFENFSSQYGGIINYKGHFLSIENSNFLNSNASLTGGAIIGKYFPKTIGDVSVPSDAMLIENCTFSNISSSSNGGSIYMDLDS